MPGPGKGGGDSSETTRPGPHRAAPHGTGRIVVMPMSKAEAHRNPLVRRVHFQDESAEPWYLEKGREAMRQANAGKAAQESIAQMESEMQNSKRKLTRQLGEWVNCLTERIECADVLDEMLEDASEDLEPTAEGGGDSESPPTASRAKDTPTAEGGGDSISPPQGHPTAEGGGVKSYKLTPPKRKHTRRSAPLPCPDRENPEAMVDHLLETVVANRDQHALRRQLKGYLRMVQTWPEEIPTRSTVPLLQADNEQESTGAVALSNLLQTRHVARQVGIAAPEEVLSAEYGRQNDDNHAHKCLFLQTRIRTYDPLNAQKWKPAVETLIDSGASRDFVNEATVQRLGLKVEKAKHPLRVQVADGRTLQINKVACVELSLDRKLAYRTRAYVMPMGRTCDVILGMTWFETMKDCDFDAVNKTLSIVHKGSRITLRGQGEAGAQMRERANSIRQSRPDFLEVISPEEGAQDMQELKRIARKALREGVPMSECIEPTLVAMQLKESPSQTVEHDFTHMAARLHARVCSTGIYRAQVAGISDVLAQQGKRVSFWVDARTAHAQVHLIHADERDCLYPFGNRPSKGAPLATERRAPEVIPSAGHRKLVTDILSGAVKVGNAISIEEYELQELAELAMSKHSAAEQLTSLFEQLVRKGETLGETFWTEDLRSKLTAQLVGEYDTVIRQELRFAEKLNEFLEPAPIRLQDEWDGRAPYERSRRMSPQELEVVREQLAELLELGMIRPSASPFGAAVMVIPKPGQPGKFRMVIDYRRLNALTVPDKWPLPDIGELLDDVGGKGHRYWCTFDLCSGFYNVPILPEHIERTAVTTPLGNYEWRVLPMGLKNAPSIFQRNMQRVFKDIPEVRIFVDDGIVGGATIEELYLNLRKVLDKLKEHNMVAKKSKLQFFKDELKFLGHVISREGISPQLEKVEAVRSWPRPTSKKDLRGFLGLVGYYSTFIYNAANVMKPLHNMTKDDGVVPATHEEWELVPEALAAFEGLKERMCVAPVLVLPNYKAALEGTQPFLVQTDASEAAMGAVLMQDQGNGWQPVSFASKTFSPAEINYSVTEKELLALVWATTDKFRHYILGTQYQLQGDHKALATLIHPGRAVNRRQARWIEILQEQGVPQMTYVKGASLVVPDALSRRPDYMQNIPTARQGLEANPEWKEWEQVLDAGDDLQHEEQRLEFFASKSRAHSMPDNSVLLPPRLVHAPKALSTRRIAVSTAPIQGDPTLPTGVMPHGRVSAALETDNGGDNGAYAFAQEADLCRTWLELCQGHIAPVLEDQTERAPMVHAAVAAVSPLLLQDKQDWQLDPKEFQRWHRFYRFTVDACTDALGRNAQLAKYWTDCLREDWRGQVVWCNPPFTAKDGLRIVEVLEKFERARLENPNTAACFILPYFQGAEWEEKLQSMRDVECVYTYATGTPLFYAKDGGRPPTRWPVQVWWCPPLRQSEESQEKRTAWLNSATTRSKSAKTVHPAPTAYTESMQQKRANTRPVATEGATAPRLDTFLEELYRAQQADDQCQQWRKSAESKQTKEFRVLGQLLWRLYDGRYQLVIPPQPAWVKNVVMQECHDVAMAGHFGKHKTLATVRQRFWWPRMVEEVTDYCKTCVTCQRIKVSRQRPAVSLHQSEPPVRRWQEVSIDWVTGLKATMRGVDAIMTVTDKLSKMVHLIPLHFKGSDAQRTARLFIDHVWRLHGMPQKIFSDRDPRLTSAFWKEVTRLTGMMSGMTTAYHPQANGGAERSNQTMEQVLRAYVGEMGTDWDQHLSAVEYAMNNTVSRATGMKPFVMMYGESPSTQLDLFTQHVMNSEKVSAGHSPQAKKFVTTWQRNLRNAQRMIQVALDQDKAGYERHTSKPHTYKVGDKVMLSAKAITSPGDRGTKWKMRAQFYGPLEVIQVKKDSSGIPAVYQLQLPFQWKIHNWFAEAKLKPFLESDTNKWPARETEEPPDTVMVDGREEYEVEEILAHRVNSSKGQPHMEWLIRWKGYGPVHDEWRRLEDINTGGMELETWRDYEALRRLEDLASNTPELVGQIREWVHTSPEKMRRKVSEYLESTVGATTPWRDASKPFRILVLYSGTGSVEKTLLATYPNAVAVSVDVNPAFHATHCCTVRQWMEMEGGMNAYAPGYFDVIWASPPCTEYSRAKTTGKPVPFCVNPQQPHRDLVTADDNVRAAQEVIQQLKPRYWFIENPVGLLTTRPVMRKLAHLRHTCTYCRYGTQFRKATHIWTNAVLREPLKCCTRDAPCAEMEQFGRHTVTAQRGNSKTAAGSGSAEAVYPIPADLVRELMNISARTDDVEMGEIALGLIASIWDGDFQHSSSADDDVGDNIDD